jgi:hypothetical protein
MEQVITVLDDTVVVNQTRFRDSPHTLVHGLASGPPASSVLHQMRGIISEKCSRFPSLSFSDMYWMK